MGGINSSKLTAGFSEDIMTDKTVSFCELFNKQCGSTGLAGSSLTKPAAVYFHPLQLPVIKNNFPLSCEDKEVGLNNSS